MRAMWNGTVIAESDDTVVVEGNHYFPVESVKPDLFKDSATHTTSPWKGKASHYSIEADGASPSPCRTPGWDQRGMVTNQSNSWGLWAWTSTRNTIASNSRWTVTT